MLDMTNMTRTAAALGNESRVSILKWLRDPKEHFPPQSQGDVERDGVCGIFIAQKLGVTPATASEHLKILANAKLVTSTRLGKWTDFRRTQQGLDDFIELLKGL